MKKIPKSYPIIVLCLFFSLFFLVACDKKQTKETATVEKVKIVGEINYAFWDKGQLPYFKECVVDFKKEYPEIKVNLLPLDWDSYWKKMEEDAGRKEMADVFWLNGPSIEKYVKEGVLLAFDEKIKESEIDLNNYPEALVKLYNVGGVQYAIPKDFDTVAVWYNKKIFDSAGVPYPDANWTWEEMLAIAKQLTKKDRSIYGITAAYREQTGIYNTIFANGGYVISEDKKSSGYHLPETQAGIQLWVDLITLGFSPKQGEFDFFEDYRWFLSGKTAMHWNGSWFLNQVLSSSLKDDIEVVEVPSINGKKATVIHGLGNCISKYTKHPEAAWKWVEFLSSEKINKLSAEKGAAIPAFHGAAKDWVEKNPKYHLETFIKAAEEYSYAYPVAENAEVWVNNQTRTMRQVFSLEKKVKEACDTLSVQMNEALKNRGK